MKRKLILCLALAVPLGAFCLVGFPVGKAMRDRKQSAQILPRTSRMITMVSTKPSPPLG
jgi:hypothetical protein